ncbi:MAG: TetR family transcriptional regulator [Acidobacteria bacterium]|nr:TetR family transcriptional regulator [Acidobacteriota bacterium]
MSVQVKLSRLSNDDRLLHIYRAAAKVIHQKGYDATSLNDIAAVLGITKGGLYHYINGKQSLLFKIVSYALDLLDAEVVKPVKNMADAEQRLRTLIELHSTLIIDKGIEMTILLDESTGLTSEDLATIAKRRNRHYRFVRGIVERLKADGKLHPNIDVTIITHNIIGQLQWLARWYHPGGSLKRKKMIEEFTKSVLAGVLRQEPQLLAAGKSA